jgi:hypothetical protein
MNQIDIQTPVHTSKSINPRRWRQIRPVLLALALGCVLLASMGASSATAAGFGVTTFTNKVLNQNGTAATQAGSHPYEMVTNIQFATNASNQPTDNVKDVVVGLPPGLIGNPNATPQCPVAQLNSNTCPADSQVGQLAIFLGGSPITEPLFNVVPPAGQPAAFGANILLVNTYLDVTVRTGSDYGLTTTSSNISTLLPLTGIQVTLWGVPSDPGHDADRACPGFVSPCSVTAPQKPLLTTPASCTGQLTSTLKTDAWDTPGDFITRTSKVPGMTGCNRLSFDPSLSVQPDTSVADSPAGVNVDLHVPQAPDVPTSLVTPSVKNSVVTLPQGIALSPGAADGLQACSQAQFGLTTAAEPTCPNASKIGSAEIDSPISADPLVGSIYLAQQNSNPFNSTFAIYVATEADGVLIKLAARIDANPSTGQLTTTFDNNPQLPFSDFKLNFYSGPRAALMTGESCGTGTVTSDITPFSAPTSGPDAKPTTSITINSGCASGFAPSFSAGVTNAQAGAYSPFDVSFSRSDTDQDLSGLTVTLPPGVSAKLADVPLCSEAQIAHATTNSGAAELASSSCPASSQVGVASTGAGPGSNPFFLSGKVYLTGPYKGGPYGLVVIVPAVAGPLDLGTVVVRQALNIDPTDAHVTVTSDPFPTILKGVPLRLRRVDVNLNRPNFTLNPTSCNPMQITGNLTSAAGAAANDSSRFQVGGCTSLGFSPKLKIGLSGKGQNHSGKHPTLTADLTQGTGQANISLAKVTLPKSLALDPKNSKVVCDFATAQAVHGGAVGCPASTIVGTASATTPLLSQPLTGNVYLVQGIRFGAQGQQIRTLPSLLVPLRGQFAIDLRAQTSVNGQSALVTTFSGVPDVPVSAFQLSLTGGSKGLLEITGTHLNICKKAQTTKATINGQSGKQENLSIKMAKPCRATHHKKKK